MSSTPALRDEPAMEPECEDASFIRSRVRSPYIPRRDVLTRVRHDLRSLVHAVAGYSDLLASPAFGALSPEQQRFVAHVRAAADQLQDLTDACIELTMPVDDQSCLALPVVPLVAALQHVQGGLRAEHISAVVDVAPELRSYEAMLELPLLLRAMKVLAQVVTRGGGEPCLLGASRSDQRVILRVARADAVATELCDVESLTEELGNREFVKLKLAEVLLQRQGMRVRVSRTLDAAELTLR